MTAVTSGAPASLGTGANQGIGLETVRRLVGARHRVYLTARDAELGRAAAEEAGARGHSVKDGTDAVIAFALGGSRTPTGAFRERDGGLAW